MSLYQVLKLTSINNEWLYDSFFIVNLNKFSLILVKKLAT